LPLPPARRIATRHGPGVEAVDSRLGVGRGQSAQSRFSQTPNYRAFRGEARTTAMLNHPGIASVSRTMRDPDGGRRAHRLSGVGIGQRRAASTRCLKTGPAGCRCGTRWTARADRRALRVAHAPVWCTRRQPPHPDPRRARMKITDSASPKASTPRPVTQTGCDWAPPQYIRPTGLATMRPLARCIRAGIGGY